MPCHSGFLRVVEATYLRPLSFSAAGLSVVGIRDQYGYIRSYVVRPSRIASALTNQGPTISPKPSST